MSSQRKRRRPCPYAMQSVQVVCGACGHHCTHTLIPIGFELVSLGAVSGSTDDGFVYARCPARHCAARWTRYELVKVAPQIPRGKVAEIRACAAAA